MNVLIEQMSLVTLGVSRDINSVTCESGLSRDINREVQSSGVHGCNCRCAFYGVMSLQTCTVYDDLYVEIICMCIYIYIIYIFAYIHKMLICSNWL